MKKLSEMTKEELWQLFPIILSKPKKEWKDWYLEEEQLLKESLKNYSLRISHIGSTAIQGIWAKPTVDIMVEILPSIDREAVSKIILQDGYLLMSKEGMRRSFNKGYTERGFADKVFHLHLRNFGDNDELYFRDYMIDHPEAAKEYEKCKLSLQKPYEHDRDGYTQAKTAFVKEYTQRAKLLYKDKYALRKENQN